MKLLVEQGFVRLRDANSIVQCRYDELCDRDEVEPDPLKTLLAPTHDIDDRIVAVEACWDGGNDDSSARLVAIVKRPGRSHPRFDEVVLGSLGSADVMAKGRAVADLLGVPFHSTQPEHGDLGLPRWWDNH
jgi:hypothetical protein